MSQSISHRRVETNGISMQVAEAGQGPLVVLCHGWPELGYSWRHQLPALAAAGFRAVAPDMRGFGKTDAPADVAAYTIFHNVGDVVGLVSAFGESRAFIVGHDWGAPVAWHAALLRPDIFRAVVGLSVPHRGRGPAPPLKLLRDAGQTNYYWIYFQEPGVAERELERDVASTMRRILTAGAGDGDRRNRMSLTLEPGRGFLDGAIEPEVLPAWLTDADIKTFADNYRETGFRGGLNWYRNMDRNWELTAPWQNATISQPALFIAGTRDPVIRGPMGERGLELMPRAVPNLKDKILIEGAGHWVQQERPDEVSAALIAFLKACMT